MKSDDADRNLKRIEAQLDYKKALKSRNEARRMTEETRKRISLQLKIVASRTHRKDSSDLDRKRPTLKSPYKKTHLIPKKELNHLIERFYNRCNIPINQPTWKFRFHINESPFLPTLKINPPKRDELVNFEESFHSFRLTHSSRPVSSSFARFVDNELFVPRSFGKEGMRDIYLHRNLVFKTYDKYDERELQLAGRFPNPSRVREIDNSYEGTVQSSFDLGSFDFPSSLESSLSGDSVAMNIHRVEDKVRLVWSETLVALRKTASGISQKCVLDIKAMNLPPRPLELLAFYIGHIVGVTPDWDMVRGTLLSDSASLLRFFSTVDPLTIPAGRLQRAHTFGIKNELIFDPRIVGDAFSPAAEISRWISIFDALVGLILLVRTHRGVSSSVGSMGSAGGSCAASLVDIVGSNTMDAYSVAGAAIDIYHDDSRKLSGTARDRRPRASASPSAVTCTVEQSKESDDAFFRDLVIVGRLNTDFWTRVVELCDTDSVVQGERDVTANFSSLDVDSHAMTAASGKVVFDSFSERERWDVENLHTALQKSLSNCDTADLVDTIAQLAVADCDIGATNNVNKAENFELESFAFAPVVDGGGESGEGAPQLTVRALGTLPLIASSLPITNDCFPSSALDANKVTIDFKRLATLNATRRPSALLHRRSTDHCCEKMCAWLSCPSTLLNAIRERGVVPRSLVCCKSLQRRAIVAVPLRHHRRVRLQIFALKWSYR